MSTFDRVKEIIVDQLGVEEEQVTLEARFREDLKADSRVLGVLSMAFEVEFGGEIPDEDAQGSLSVRDAVQYLENQL